MRGVKSGFTKKTGFSKEILESKLAGLRDGHHVNGAVPYGYRRPKRQKGDARPRDLEIDPVEGEVVRGIFSGYLKERSLTKIEDALRVAGVKTKKGRKFGKQQVSLILTNRFYLGRVKFFGEERAGRHPALVSMIVFNRVAKILAENNRRRAKKGEETAHAA